MRRGVGLAAWMVLTALGLVLAMGAPATADPLGQITEFSSGLNSDSLTRAMTAGADGNLWFTDAGGTQAIGRITPSGQITEFSAGLGPGSNVSGLALGPDGNVWFTDPGTPAVGRISPSGQITEFTAGLPAGSNPLGIATGPDGNLWFADEGSPRARSAGSLPVGRSPSSPPG